MIVNGLMQRVFEAILLIWVLGVASVASGQETLTHVTLPHPAGSAPSDPSIQNLAWNKWDTANFTILSIDEAQGRYLFENIEQMKTWVLSRWGLPDVKFSAQCKVLCVPNKDLLKKLFRLDNSQGEVRRNQDGTLNMTVLWLVLDTKPAEVIPPALTQVCLSEFEQSQRLKFPLWTYRGMSILNGTLPQIRADFGSLGGRIDTDQRMFFGNKLFMLTEDEWRKSDVETKKLYDQQAGAMCLLLRKEFGQKNFHSFMSLQGSEQDLAKVYGFRGYSEFDSTYKRFMKNLSADVTSGRTPDAYLQISPSSE
jgi:hypothetical protein